MFEWLKFRGKATFAVGVLLASSAALAQNYPSRPVTLIVPYGPGGGADISARTVAQKLTERLGQQFVVENRPGGGGNLGTEYAAKSAPDGYTLLMASPGNAVNATLFRQLPFNPATDFTPVALVGAVAIFVPGATHG